MFDFNFLSTQEQKRYVRWVLLQHASIGLALTAVLLASVAAVVFVAQLSMNTLVTAAQQESASLMETQKRLSTSETAATQKTLQQLQSVQAGHQPYLSHLDLLLQSVPPEIELHSIDIDYATNEIYVSGTAQTRQAFISFQQRIDESEEVDITEVPLDLLAKTYDITFRLRLELIQP